LCRFHVCVLGFCTSSVTAPCSVEAFTSSTRLLREQRRRALPRKVQLSAESAEHRWSGVLCALGLFLLCVVCVCVCTCSSLGTVAHTHTKSQSRTQNIRRMCTRFCPQVLLLLEQALSCVGDFDGALLCLRVGRCVLYATCVRCVMQNGESAICYMAPLHVCITDWASLSGA